MTRPTDLPEHEHRHLDDLLDACPHLTVLTEQVGAFAGLLTAQQGHDLGRLDGHPECRWSSPMHTFVRGLRKDLPAVIAGLPLSYSDGPIEGANTKVKLKRQMYGRAGFAPAPATDSAHLNRGLHLL